MKEQPNANAVFLSIYQEIRKTRHIGKKMIIVPSYREVCYVLCTPDWRKIPYDILSKFCSRIKLFFQESKFTIGFYVNDNRSCNNCISIWGIGYDGILSKFFRRKSYPIFVKKAPKKFIEKLIGISKELEYEFSGILAKIFLTYNVQRREYSTPLEYYRNVFTPCDKILSKFVGGRV